MNKKILIGGITAGVVAVGGITTAIILNNSPNYDGTYCSELNSSDCIVAKDGKFTKSGYGYTVDIKEGKYTMDDVEYEIKLDGDKFSICMGALCHNYVKTDAVEPQATDYKPVESEKKPDVEEFNIDSKLDGTYEYTKASGSSTYEYSVIVKGGYLAYTKTTKYSTGNPYVEDYNGIVEVYDSSVESSNDNLKAGDYYVKLGYSDYKVTAGNGYIKLDKGYDTVILIKD